MGGSMTKILPGLYVGGFDNAKNEEELMANCISHIIIVQNSKNDIEKSISRQYLHLIVNEKLENSLLKQIPLSNDFIHQARLDSGNVLVCSDSGLSANVAVVAAYIMTIYALDFHSAIRTLRNLRYTVYPVESLQKQLIEFDCSSNKTVDNQNHPNDHLTTPTITSASEHDRLNSIYGEWPYLEEDLQILYAALNSTDDNAEFLFHSEIDKTLPNNVVCTDNPTDDNHNNNNDSNPTIVTTNSTTTSSISTITNDHSIKLGVHTVTADDHVSSPQRVVIQSHSTLLHQQQDDILVSNNNNTSNSNNGANHAIDNVINNIGENVLDSSSIPFVTVPINGVLVEDDTIEQSSVKPSSPTESDVFIVDSTQLPENCKHLSNRRDDNDDDDDDGSSSFQSEHSLEIGFEIKDETDDNIPGAIEIPIIDSSTQSRNRVGTAHTYNHHHHYSRSNNLSHNSLHTNIVAHSLYPCNTEDINSSTTSSKFIYQPLCSNMNNIWNSYSNNNYYYNDRFIPMHTTTDHLKNYSNLSTTAPNCDIYFKT
ncbi:unnamed protein product [Schistosoma turkestanicum]|nr:unnamed protein product [Schistosoma turkestanicum]